MGVAMIGATWWWWPSSSQTSQTSSPLWSKSYASREAAPGAVAETDSASIGEVCHEAEGVHLDDDFGYFESGSPCPGPSQHQFNDTDYDGYDDCESKNELTLVIVVINNMGGFTSVAERAIRRMTKEATGRCIIVMIDFLDEQNKTSDEAFFRRVFVHKGHLFASCMMTLLPFSSLLTFLPLQTSHYCLMCLPSFLTRNRVYIHDSLCFFLSAEKN